MKLKLQISILLFLVLLAACQQEEPEINQEIVYSDDIYELKEYKVERHPPVVRNGFGMDMYHEGDASSDTLYLDESLPPYHPNNPGSSGFSIKRYNKAVADSVLFEYDLLFYNEFAYVQQPSGDYSSTGYPAIFMYTDPMDDNKSTKAAMIGTGIDDFNAFGAGDISAYKGSLRSDPLIDLSSHRTEIHTSAVDGFVFLRDDAENLYASLVIGNKFRPNIGGVFDLPNVEDEIQIDMQPVFLIKTREGLYAKFMVTRFKGVGEDTQRLLLQWQALQE